MHNLPSVAIITPTLPSRFDMSFRLGKYIVSKQDYGGALSHISCLNDMTIGAKRNELISESDYDIIIHMDDDDIYTPDWISKSVAALIESKAAIVGLSNAYFHNITTDRVYEYDSPKGQLFLCGATLCYWRSVWEKKPFKDISKGEDADFITNAGKLYCHGYKDGFLAILHGNNTCSHLSVPAMKKLPQFEAAGIINHFYASAG